ncbi:MAG: tetratricopeptide repeat protein [Proteobacteria bacterium]|nr:tetratricopeptide repeat protein [Pseudomonadota bacterium]
MNSTAENSKEEQPQKPPVLDDFFFHAADYIHRRKKIFTILTIAFVGALLLGYGISWYIQYLDDTRNRELYIIEKAINQGQLDATEKFTKGVPLLNDFINQNSGTSQERIAIFYRANLYSGDRQLVEAENDLRSLLSMSEKASGFYVLASIYLANILRDQNKQEQSLEVLQRAQSEIMTDVILMELAEIYASQKNNTLVKQNLDALMKDYPSSLYIGRAKRMLEQISQ